MRLGRVAEPEVEIAGGTAAEVAGGSAGLLLLESGGEVVEARVARSLRS